MAFGALGNFPLRAISVVLCALKQNFPGTVLDHVLK